MKQKIQKAHTEMLYIRNSLKMGQLSYGEAKEQAIKPLQLLNAEAQHIASKHNMRHKPITFTGFMR